MTSRRARRAERAARTSRTVRGTAAGLGLTLAACVLTALAPPSWRAADPFVTVGAVGETVTGRDIAVTVDDVVRADSVIADDTTFTGTWLAVRLTAQATTNEDNLSLQLTRALIDGRVFHGSTNVDDTLRGVGLRIGSGMAGWVVFELPEDIRLDEVEVQFLTELSMPLRGSVVAVRADEIPRVADVEITRPELVDAP